MIIPHKLNQDTQQSYIALLICIIMIDYVMCSVVKQHFGLSCRIQADRLVKQTPSFPYLYIIMHIFNLEPWLKLNMKAILRCHLEAHWRQHQRHH